MLFSTERKALLWKRSKFKGVTALPLWKPSNGVSVDERAGGGMLGFWESPTKLSSFSADGEYGEVMHTRSTIPFKNSPYLSAHLHN